MKTQNHKNLLGLKALITVISVTSLSLFYAGCASGANERRGTAAGAATGAIIGGIIGHQSGEEGEGAAIGAAAGAVVGNQVGRSKDQNNRQRSRTTDVNTNVDYGDLMTPEEKERVLERSGERFISDWEKYLTSAEKRDLLNRADRNIGS